jgi:hypothetical protein
VGIVKIRLFILAFLLFLPCITSTRADTEELEAVWAMLGNFAVGCDNMTVVRLPSDDFEFGSGEKLPLDLSACNTHLAPTSVVKIYKQEPLRPMALQKLRNFFNDLRFDRATKQTHERARPLFEACKAAQSDVNSKTSYICYFGGPTTTSNTVFKAHFQTLVEASLPNSETICSPDPLRKDSSVSEIFTRMLDKDQTTLSWLKLQTSLQAEGYACGKDNCSRPITGIYIPSKARRQSEEFRRNEIEFLIIPRLLSIYRGDWQPLGAFGCLEDIDGKKSGRCSPSKGASSGICMSVEGGRHGIGFLIMGVNGIE